MGNWQSFLVDAGVLVSCVTVFVGCTSLNKRDDDAAPQGVKLSEPVLLRFKGEEGRVEKMRYYSASSAETHEDGQLTRKKEEAVDFTVESRFKESVDNVIVFSAETVAKDGQVGLHDLAFPELNEILEMKIKDSATVLQAGPYPPTSVFFVPPIPLPAGLVEVGDTWTYKHEWISMASGIPLQVDLVMIFKSVHRCGEGRCVDLEVSGNVVLLGPLKERMEFLSEISGHLLFSIEQGTLVATRISNREAMQTGNTFMRVKSCMIGQLLQPELRVKGLDLSKETCSPESFSPLLSIK